MPPVAPIPMDVSNRLINFDPLFYGHDEYINSARFKTCLSTPGESPEVARLCGIPTNPMFLDNSFATPALRLACHFGVNLPRRKRRHIGASLRRQCTATVTD